MLEESSTSSSKAKVSNDGPSKIKRASVTAYGRRIPHYNLVVAVFAGVRHVVCFYFKLPSLDMFVQWCRNYLSQFEPPLSRVSPGYRPHGVS